MSFCTASQEKNEKLERALSRASIVTESVKGLLVVNGGGSVALLAFLQAIWGTEPQLAKATLYGIAAMSMGLVFALLVQPLRITHSKIVEKEGDKKTSFWFAYVVCQYASIGSFLVAVSYLVLKGLALASPGA